jgi:4-diphosphocytidyl-2C-methyl-D-erythritol kinase
MKTKKFATMTGSGAKVVTATSKKEATEKLEVKVKDVYRYDA